MATRGKKKATKKKTAKKKTAKKKTKKKSSRKSSSSSGMQVSRRLAPKPAGAVRKAAEALWDVGIAPHDLLQELHQVLLLRCLKEADGNYAAAAAIFGPSRQSVQQFANSELRDERWKQFQQNRRKRRG